MNILVITDIIPNDEKGGSGKTAWELAKYLKNKGHEIKIITRRVKKFKKNEIIDGIEIYRYKFPIYSLPKTDIVILHSPYSGISLLAKNIPIIYMYHSPWPEEYLIKANYFNKFFLIKKFGVFLRNTIEEKLLNISSKIVVHSNFILHRLKFWHKKINERKIEIIPPGIDITKFIPQNDKKKVREELNLPKDKFILLTIRNLRPRMGLKNLILATKRLSEKYKNIFLIIGGTGELENELKEMSKSLGLEKFIYFPGVIDEKDIVKYYQAADLFILPTEFLEGFGLVTLEALSCGTPVLATPVGGTVEIFEKFDTKFLFNGITHDDIYEGIDKFISNPPLDELKLKLRKFVEENYSFEKYASRIEKLFT
jgi:glycosyltransferase involved in cell wall biosynthesis